MTLCHILPERRGWVNRTLKIVLCYTPDTRWGGWEWNLTDLRRCCRCILQSQPKGPVRIYIPSVVNKKNVLTISYMLPCLIFLTKHALMKKCPHSTHTHTHTHTYIYIYYAFTLYIYIYIYIYIYNVNALDSLLHWLSEKLIDVIFRNS